jgi:hypothetical protein
MMKRDGTGDLIGSRRGCVEGRRECTGPEEGGEENDAAERECYPCSDIDLPASLRFVSQGVDLRL